RLAAAQAAQRLLSRRPDGLRWHITKDEKARCKRDTRQPDLRICFTQQHNRGMLQRVVLANRAAQQKLLRYLRHRIHRRNALSCRQQEALPESLHDAKQHDLIAKANLIALAQLLRPADARPIDKCAIRAAFILDDPPSSLKAQ